jgi:hypothetical protein
MSLTDEDKRWIETKLQTHTDTIVERMRDIENELLRRLEAHSAGITIRMRKLEANQSNLDTSVSGRVEILERRLAEIEKRLGLPGIA